MRYISRILMSAGLAASILFMSGCGAKSLDDDFIFGKNRVSCNNATITVSVPFELVSGGQLAELMDKSSEKIYAEGHNRYIHIIVTGYKDSDGRTPETEAAKAEEQLAKGAAVSDLKTEKSTAKIGDATAEVRTFTFTEEAKGKKANLTAKEYIFNYGGVLWRVIYEYYTGDATGEALADRLAGKVETGVVF